MRRLYEEAIACARFMYQPSEQPYVRTGGARVGWMNVTWPFAELWTAPERLTITARFLGTYTFAPDQICEIEPYIMVPILGWGVRIRHCVPNYPNRVVFWSLTSPYGILRGIRESGFTPTGAAPVPGSLRRGFPIRWSVVVGVIVLWNALLLADGGILSVGPAHPSWSIYVALLMVLVLSVGTLTSTGIQRIVLKRGGDLGEVKPFLRLLALISGLLLLVLLMRPPAGTSRGTPNPRAEVWPGMRCGRIEGTGVL